MSSLFFPQLNSGALVQYPIEKKRQVRTVTNVLPDGTAWRFQDVGARSLTWHLTYIELELADVQALQAHFEACRGPLLGFTFIDPTANMLANSETLSATRWLPDAALKLEAGYPDPNGGTSAWRVTNTGQAAQAILQILSVPAHYQYCFSFYAQSISGADLIASRSGTVTRAESAHFVSGGWQRIVSSGRLNDLGAQLTVGVSVGPGQQVMLYGMQLEAQEEPSTYIASSAGGGVYANAHWGTSDFQVVAQSPGWYATSFVIEASGEING